MEQGFSARLKSIMLITGTMLLLVSVKAQKEKPVISQDVINKVIEIVKPLREQADKLLKDDATGTFKAYQDEIRKMGSLKNNAEKSQMAGKIREKYEAWFKKIWSNMKVDEKAYQQQIRMAFPVAMRETISFQPFLNFSYNRPIKKNGTATELPPAIPENKCIDVCAMAAGEINGSAALISGGAGSYGNCFLRASGWGAAAGKNELYSYLRNNISIPGTLPADARKLRVRKTYELKQEATSFAVLGFGYSETWVATYQSDEYLFVMSPVIFGASKTVTKTMNEDYLIEKADVSKSIFKAYAGTMAYFISGNWCFSECNNIVWNICEEK